MKWSNGVTGTDGFVRRFRRLVRVVPVERHKGM